LEGFERAHPNNLPKTSKLTKEEKQKSELADRFLRAKGIKTSEKTEIYKLICGKEPTSKRGRPSLAHRNVQVTIDFLSLMGETTASSRDIIRHLSDIYKLPRGDNDNEYSDRSIGSVNFNKIIVQNLEALELYFTEYVNAVDCGMFEDKKGIYDNNKTCLKGLARYKTERKKAIS
jgi:hypothetical protein